MTNHRAYAIYRDIIASPIQFFDNHRGSFICGFVLIILGLISCVHTGKGQPFGKGNFLKAHIAAHEYAHHDDIDLQWSISSSRSLNYPSAALIL
jgi:hypothetical protein